MNENTVPELLTEEQIKQSQQRITTVTGSSTAIIDDQK